MRSLLCAALFAISGVAAAASAACAAQFPRVAHVVVIVEENKPSDAIVGNPSAPYINSLVKSGAYFTNAHGVTHPSLPNYLALFSGLTNDNADGCPATGIDPRAPNLGSELLAAHKTFAGYSESLPERGWTGCAAGEYGRKHAPWVAFANVPSAVNLPFADFPRFDRLPTVSFVVPNVQNDMHDGTIAQGDAWLRTNVAPLLAWARRNDTLVILTWDEDDGTAANLIPTAFIGPMVKAGRYTERVDHYRVLRTLEDLYGLPHAGKSAGVAPIADCWIAG